jgi:SAM-dependent methyltransferase
LSLFYKLAYRLGFAPWEKAATHPAAVRQINALFDREEHGQSPPYGAVLDLGCGRGHWSIVLAQRGWQVTGIDLEPRALTAAKARAAEAGVPVQFLHGDITALRSAGVASGVRLVWDFGTVHGLPDAARATVGREITALAAPNATLLLLAWAPGRRGPLPRGASRQDLEQAFPAWHVVAEEPFDTPGLRGPLRNVDPRIYRLQRA